MRESYPPADPCSSPAPPDLPDWPSRRFQFSLKHLLAYMFACAVLAAGIRYIVQWMERLPKHELIGLTSMVVVGLAFGGLLYFLVRAPFLVYHAVSFHLRWKRVQRHRLEMTAWSQQQRERARQQPPSNE